MTDINIESPNDAVDEAETLIGRVSANDARELDWQRFESIAVAQPVVWERMARALRDELVIRGAFDEIAEPAESVPLPEQTLRATNRLAAIQAWPGWALAAVIALAWGVSFFNPPVSQSHEAGLGGVIVPVRHSADEAFNDYLTLGAQEGRVLQELPMMMIESRFDRDQGRVEVVYVRQLLERATVQSAFELTEDALGRPEPVPIDLTILRTDKPL